MLHPSDLHMIGVFSNPVRTQSRPRLLREWIHQKRKEGVTLHVVQHTFGERDDELSVHEEILQGVHLYTLRGGPEHELWLKEGMINFALAQVFHQYPQAKYIAWGDTDVNHVRHDWVIETLHMLQHHRVGQTWTHSVDLDPNGNVARNEWGNDVDRSFCAAWGAGDIEAPRPDYGCPQHIIGQKLSKALLEDHKVEDWRRHFGYEWAARASVLREIGGLIPWLITGSGDYHMAMAFGGMLVNFDAAMKPGYVRRLKEYAHRCELHVKQDIGCVDGIITHGWHGRKKDRKYLSRFGIIKESGFDPDVDIVLGPDHLPRLITDNRVLRDGLRRYNRQRNEDSVDLA